MPLRRSFHRPSWFAQSGRFRFYYGSRCMLFDEPSLGWTRRDSLFDGPRMRLARSINDQDPESEQRKRQEQWIRGDSPIGEVGPMGAPSTLGTPCAGTIRDDLYPRDPEVPHRKSTLEKCVRVMFNFHLEILKARRCFDGPVLPQIPSLPPIPGSLYALTRMVNGWVSLAWCFTRADDWKSAGTKSSRSIRLGPTTHQNEGY